MNTKEGQCSSSMKSESSYRAIVPGLAFSEEDAKPEKYASNVDVEILRSCNFTCRYCYLDRSDQLYNDPSKEQLFHIIDEISGISPRNVLFTGGEPLLRKDFFDILEYAVKERDLSTSIFTNGFFITRMKAKLLGRYQVKVCVKMDTLDTTVQDKLTGVSGSGIAIRKAISNLKKEGYENNLPLTIHACITRLNCEELDELYDWARSNRVTPASTRLVPWGMGKTNFEYLGLSKEQLRSTFLKLRGDDRIPFPTKIGCVKMYKSCFINSLGTVQPCSNVLISAGNIFRTELKEILQGKVFKVARSIRDHLKGECKVCSNNDICYGCRGLTHSMTGDWLGEDPLCWHTDK